MRYCEHNGVRLFSDAPVVGSFQSNGRTILTLCRRNLHDAILDMGLLVEILPQNDITKQEVNHAKPVVGVAGDVGIASVSVLGSVPCGKAGR